MLEVDITKRYKEFELNVSFTLEKGRLSLFGPSGSGKSLTLRCIAGIETPDEGRIVLGGRVLFDSRQKINLPPQKRRVGLLFQHYALFPNMTLQKNLEMGQREKNPERIRDMIKDFSLVGLEELYPHQLSGGQQQRVALARMLLNDPEILLLDEPFSALDTHLRAQVEWEVLEILGRYTGSAICVSHNMEETYRFSREIAIFHEGRIEEIGKREKFFQSPGTLNGARLVGLKNIAAVSSHSNGSYLPEYDLLIPEEKKEDFLAIPPMALSTERMEGAMELFCELVEILPGIEEDIGLYRHRKGEKLLQLTQKKAENGTLPCPATLYLEKGKWLWLAP